MGRFLILGAAILAAGLGILVYAVNTGGSEILLQDVQAQLPAEAGGTGYLYLTVQNTGAVEDRLVGVTTGIAEGASFHSHFFEHEGHETPHSLDSIPLAPGESVSLGPESSHIEFSNVGTVLQQGQLFPVTLVFERAGALEVSARVLKSDDTLAQHAHGAGSGVSDTPVSHDHSELHDVAEGEPVPSLSLSLAEDPGGGWNLHIVTRNFRFAPESVNQPHAPGEGHAHLYADGTKLARLYGPWRHIGSLPAGTRTLTVTLNTNDHKSLAVGGKPVDASITLETLN